jgi:hypothetical protein
MEEWELPVQTVYRGLGELNPGKGRNPAREQPGKPRSDSWKPTLYPKSQCVKDVTAFFGNC